jgi:hypothetical protein
MNWKSSVEEGKMTVKTYMAQYILDGHKAEFWCIETK